MKSLLFVTGLVLLSALLISQRNNLEAMIKARADQQLKQQQLAEQVVIYTMQSCPFSRAKLRELKKSGIPFTQCPIDEDTRCGAQLAYIMNTNGHTGRMLVPTVVVNGRYLRGGRPEDIQQHIRY